jgi:hypothetical protein
MTVYDYNVTLFRLQIKLCIWYCSFNYTRAVCKFHGLTLLLRVRTLWRCGDGLFFEVPPSASNAFLTTLHPFLENVLQTVDHFEISCFGASFSWLEKSRNHVERDLNCMADVLMGFHRSTFSKLNTPRHEEVWGSGGKASRLLNFGSKWCGEWLASCCGGFTAGKWPSVPVPQMSV